MVVVVFGPSLIWSSLNKVSDVAFAWRSGCRSTAADKHCTSHWGANPSPPLFGCTPKGRTATQRSKKGSEKVLGRVLGKGFSEGF